jgi:hypothetical protein
MFLSQSDSSISQESIIKIYIQLFTKTSSLGLYLSHIDLWWALLRTRPSILIKNYVQVYLSKTKSRTDSNHWSTKRFNLIGYTYLMSLHLETLCNIWPSISAIMVLTVSVCYLHFSIKSGLYHFGPNWHSLCVPMASRS